MEARQEHSSVYPTPETPPEGLGNGGPKITSSKSTILGNDPPNQPSNVRVSVLESSTNISEDFQPVSKKSIRQSFGIAACVTLIGGTIITILVLGFLIFLWFGEGPVIGGEQASPTWRNIMLGEWLPQFITLSSLVIRLTIGAQASLCTSMCAALILERRKVLKSQVAQYSLLRALNDGPYNLIKLSLRHISGNFSLHPEFALLVCLCLAVLGTQFSSTILLPDLDDASIVQSPSTTSLKLYAGPDIDIDTSATDYWSEKPLSFPTFGETPLGYFAQPNQRGVSDTGVKRRVLLPFHQTEDREALRGYNGNAFILSSRVACMPPTITGEFIGSNYSDIYYGTIGGRVSYEDTFMSAGVPSARICNSERCLSPSFNCTVMSRSSRAEKYSTSYSFCFPQSIHEEQYDPSAWRLDDDPWGPESSPILVMSSQLHTADWKEMLEEPFIIPNSTVEEEWSKFELRPGKFMRISLCFMGLNVMFSEVRLQSPEKRSISNTEVTANKSAQDIATKDIQILLGTEPTTQDPSERGVFSVENIVDNPEHVFFSDKNRNLSTAQNTTSALEVYLIYTAQQMAGNVTVSACIRCSGYQTQATNPLYANLFSAITQSSNRPAVALQSVYTVLGQSVYYDILDVFDEPQDAIVTKARSVRIPRRSHGIIAVTILVFMCLLCVWSIAGLFWRYSRYTLLGETWHTVSQLVGNETNDIMSRNGMARDKDVGLLLKDDDPYVSLEQLSTGRVEIVRSNNLLVVHAKNRAKS